MSLPAAGYFSNASRTEGEMKTAFEDQLKGIRQIPGAGQTDQLLTLAADVLTPASGLSGIIQVDTEGAAASDNLATIAQTNVDDGSILILRNTALGRVITVKHNAGGTGQISLHGAADTVLSDPERQWLMLKRAGTSWKEIRMRPSGAPRGHLWGLTCSNNGTDPVSDIDIAVGEALSDDTNPDDAVLMRLTTAITKQLDIAWAVGTAAGMKSGTALADGTWHLFLIMRPDTGVVDVFADTSLTPTLPTNYTKKRRIFSLVRASAAIKLFVQDADFVQWSSPTLDINVTNPGTAAVTRVVGVPTGRNFVAVFNYRSSDPTAANSPIAYFSDLATTDLAPSATATPLGSNNPTATSNIGGLNKVLCRTDTAASIRSRVSASSATSVLAIATLGYYDSRGKDN